jgi:hypothetical protein
MSHFVANQISFDKEFKTFKVKWWDNNVVPRSNNWSNDIDIKYLFWEFCWRNIQYNGTSNIKLLKINYLINKYSKIIRENIKIDLWLIMNIDISWNKEDFLPSEKQLEYWQKDNYTKLQNEEKLYIYNNFEKIKEYIFSLKQDFLKELKNPLKEEQYEYHIVRRDWYYVAGIRKWWLDLWTERQAKNVNYYIWQNIISSYENYKLEKIN